MVVLSLIASILQEVAGRRKYLLQNHQLLGPGGELKAARWPLGSLKGITMCLSIFLGLLWGFSLILQTLLLVSLLQAGS
jgi:hypothetical protein